MNKHSSKMFTVGIAGYMGSGKTTFSSFLAQQTGFTLVNGDLVAKELMNSRIPLQDALRTAFGPEVIWEGVVDSGLLGAVVFSDYEKLKLLNSIVHPVLLDSLRNMIFRDAVGAVIVDAALLPLWNIREWFDALIWIEAPGELRCTRICRKGAAVDPGAVKQRMMLQENLFPKPPPDVWTYIDNKGELSDLQAAAARLSDILLPMQSCF